MTAATKQERTAKTVDNQFPGAESPMPNPKSDPIKVTIFDERQQANVTMQARWEEITPEYARYVWNRLNTVNRKVKIGNANRLANAIHEERFVTTGETIIFDANGDLQNGQHRIYGVCKGGKSITALVVRGANPRNFTKIDRGATRGADDCLHIRGVKHADSVARLARRVKQWEDSKKSFVSRRGAALDNDEILTYVEGRPSLIISADYVRNLTGNRSVGLLTPTWLAFIHYIASAEDVAMADEFLRLLTGPASDLLASGNQREVISHLRVRLDKLSENKKKRHVQVPDNQFIGTALAAWNVFCREGRRTIKKFVAPRRIKDKVTGRVSYAMPARIGRPTDQAKQSVLAFRQQQQLLRQQFGDQ